MLLDEKSLFSNECFKLLIAFTGDKGLHHISLNASMVVRSGVILSVSTKLDHFYMQF